MKKSFLVHIYIFISVWYAMGQINLSKDLFKQVVKDEQDTVKWLWKWGYVGNSTLSYSTLSNWAAGGDPLYVTNNNFANIYLKYKKSRLFWDNNLDAYLGFFKANKLNFRKNDDRFDLASKYGYSLDIKNKLLLTGLANLRSQLFNGYTYQNDTTATLSSAFMSPGYLILSIGLDWKKDSALSVFFSPLTYRLTTVTNRILSQKDAYGVLANQKILHDIGTFISINYRRTISANIRYIGKLDLFSSYNNNPQNVDLYSTNLFIIKLGKYFNATYSLDLIYDDDVRLFGPEKKSPALQVKSLLGIGFIVTGKDRIRIPNK